MVLEREYEHEVPALRMDLVQYKKDLAHEQLRVADFKQTLEQERGDRVEVGATMVERDREVRRLTAEGEQKEMNHAREMTALKKAWQTEKTMLIVRAKEIAAAGEERHRESVRKAKRKLEAQQRKIAALSMDKVTLLEGGRRPAAAGDEDAEEQAGGAVTSIFAQELDVLNDRQTSYTASVSSDSGSKKTGAK